MVQAVDNVSLLLWQPTLLAWSVGGAVILLGILMVTLFVISKKNAVKKRTRSIFEGFKSIWILLAALSNVLAIFLLVDMGLGWKLSLLAGVVLILCTVFLIGMIERLFARKLSVKKKLSRKIELSGSFDFFAVVLLLAAIFGLVKLQLGNYDFGKPIGGKGGFPYLSSPKSSG